MKFLPVEVAMAVSPVLDLNLESNESGPAALAGDRLLVELSAAEEKKQEQRVINI